MGEQPQPALGNEDEDHRNNGEPQIMMQRAKSHRVAGTSSKSSKSLKMSHSKSTRSVSSSRPKSASRSISRSSSEYHANANTNHDASPRAKSAQRPARSSASEPPNSNSNSNSSVSASGSVGTSATTQKISNDHHRSRSKSTRRLKPADGEDKSRSGRSKSRHKNESSDKDAMKRRKPSRSTHKSSRSVHTSTSTTTKKKSSSKKSSHKSSSAITHHVKLSSLETLRKVVQKVSKEIEQKELEDAAASISTSRPGASSSAAGGSGTMPNNRRAMMTSSKSIRDLVEKPSVAATRIVGRVTRAFCDLTDQLQALQQSDQSSSTDKRARAKTKPITDSASALLHHGWSILMLEQVEDPLVQHNPVQALATLQKPSLDGGSVVGGASAIGTGTSTAGPTATRMWTQIALLLEGMAGMLEDCAGSSGSQPLTHRVTCAYVTLVELTTRNCSEWHRLVVHSFEHTPQEEEDESNNALVWSVPPVVQAFWSSTNCGKPSLKELRDNEFSFGKSSASDHHQDIKVDPLVFRQLATQVVSACIDWRPKSEWQAACRSPINATDQLDVESQIQSRHGTHYDDDDDDDDDESVISDAKIDQMMNSTKISYEPDMSSGEGSLSDNDDDDEDDDFLRSSSDLYSSVIVSDVPTRAAATLGQIRSEPLLRPKVLKKMLKALIPSPLMTDDEANQKQGDNKKSSSLSSSSSSNAASASNNNKAPLLLSGIAVPTLAIASVSSSYMKQHTSRANETVGMSGLGQTTMAAIVASRLDVRAYFNGGIVWLKLGNHAMDGGLRHDFYMDCLASICKQLGYTKEDDDDHDHDKEQNKKTKSDKEEEEEVVKFMGLVRIPFEEESVHNKSEELLMRAAKEKMSSILRLKAERNKFIMIVLDDVWEEDDIDWFRFDSDNLAHILITTKSRALPATHNIQIDLLSEQEALELLMTESDHPRNHVISRSAEARDIVKACEYHPLTIRTVARWYKLKEASAGVVKGVEEIQTEVLQCSDTIVHDGAEGRMLFGMMDRMLSPAMNGKPTQVMKFCLAALVKVFFQHKSADGSSVPVPKPIPLESAHSLWEAILKLEEKTLFGGKSLDAAQRRRQVLLITRAFDSMGLVHIWSKETEEDVADWRSTMTPGSKELLEQSYITIHHDMQQAYAESLFANGGLSPALVKDFDLKWNRAFVSAYLSNKRDRDKEGTLDSSRIYALEFLVEHMLRGNMIPQAVTLLQDERFIKNRLDIQGWEQGTARHVKDTKLLCTRLKESKESGSPSSFEPTKVTLAVFEKITEFLCNEMAGVNDAYLEEGCRCIHEMGTSMVEMKCRDQALAQYKIALKLLLPRKVSFAYVEVYSVGVVLLESGDILKGLETLEGCLHGAQSNNAIFSRNNIYCRALQKIGDAMSIIGDYAEAFKHYDMALTAMYEESVHNRLLIGTVLHSKGRVLHKLGTIQQAIKEFEEGTRWKTLELGDSHFDLAMGYYWTGNAYADLDKAHEATVAYEDSLRLLKLNINHTSEEELTVRTRLVEGSFYKVAGNHKECLHAYGLALECLHENFSHNRERIADVMHMVACVHVLMGDDDKARVMFQKSLKERDNGESNADAANSLYFLGCVYVRAEETEKGLSCLKEALSIQRASFPDTDLMADTLTQIGAIQRSREDFEEAMRSYKEAFRVREELHGTDDPSVATLLQEMGELMHVSGQLNEAMVFFKECLTIRRKSMNVGDVLVAETLYWMGDTLLAQKNYVKAASCFGESLRVREATFGMSHPSVGDSLHKMGVAEYKCKNNEKALHCLFDALSNRKRHGNQLAISEVLSDIGNVRYSNEDFMLASQFYTDCLSILLEEYGPDHQSVGEIYTKLGATRAHLQDFEEAKKFYQRGLHIWKVKEGDVGKKVAGINRCLGILGYVTGDRPQAMKYFSEYLEICKVNDSQPNVDQVRVLYFVGKIHEKKGDDENAHLLWSQAYRMYSVNGFSVSHPDLGRDLNKSLEAAESVGASFFQTVSKGLFQEVRSDENDASNPDRAQLIKTANFIT